ncbi:MAG: arginine--tRNA ligase, partial [Alphaproteobacteria bacterium]|nr:arginine--tRNA ligase [Alphaproteobacteria bacterium]
MNPFRHIAAEITTALQAMAADGELPAGLDLSSVTAEPPRDPSHGDIATNAAMVLAKAARKKPRDIAEALVARLRRVAGVTDAAVAGPGFINLRLS